jgi:hypothetical protein
MSGPLFVRDPGLERAFDYSAAKGPVVMLTEYQTPAGLRRIGVRRLTTRLARRKVRGADTVAAKAVEAAQSQQAELPGEKRASRLVRYLAHRLLALDERIKDNDREIRETFRADDRTEIIESMPGLGPVLGAEFVAISATWAVHRRRSPRTLASPRSPATLDAAPATTTGPSATTGACGTCSTCRRRPR